MFNVLDGDGAMVELEDIEALLELCATVQAMNGSPRMLM